MWSEAGVAHGDLYDADQDGRRRAGPDQLQEAKQLPNEGKWPASCCRLSDVALVFFSFAPPKLTGSCGVQPLNRVGSTKRALRIHPQVLFDDSGDCVYHADCILRTFKISKGRLKRLQERIKRELRGEIARHGLYGRPSNNRKKLAPGLEDDAGSPFMSHVDGRPMAESSGAGAGSPIFKAFVGRDSDDDCGGDLESDHEDTGPTGVQ